MRTFVLPLPRDERAIELSSEVDRVRVPERCGEKHDQDARHLDGVSHDAQGHPARSAADAAEDVKLGASAEPGTVEDGEPDGDANALFDADERYGQERDHSQHELESVEASDGGDVAAMKDTRGHEDQHSRQRRERDIFQQTCGWHEKCQSDCSPETCSLSAAARRGHDCRPGRTRVHGKRAADTGEDAAYSYPDKVTSDVHLVAALVGKGPSCRCRLAEDYESDDSCNRGDTSQGRPRQADQPKAWCSVGEAAEHAHAVTVQTENADKDRGPNERHKRARKLVVHSRCYGHEGKGHKADAQSPAICPAELPAIREIL